MFGMTAAAAGVATLALVATLVIPQWASAPVSAPGAGGATYRVAADGSGQYQTINDALAAAEEGDTVLVAPGTYAEYVLIDKDVTLAGDGPREDIVVEFPEGGPVRVFEDDDEGPYTVAIAVVLEGCDAALRSLTVQVPLAGVGVLVDGGAPELVDLSVVPHPDATVTVSPHPHPSAGQAFSFENGSSPVLRDSAWAGVLYSGRSSPTIEGNTITTGHIAMDGPGEATVRGNTFLDGASIFPDFDLTTIIEGNDLGAAIVLIGPGSTTVQDNVIRGMRPIRYQEAAITVERGGEARIVGNTVTDSEGGISVLDGAMATVEGNELADNDVGIVWGSKLAGAIVGNAVHGGKTGILVRAGDPTVDGNTVCGAEADLVIAQGADPALGENDICSETADAAA